MKLTKEEERILRGEHGSGKQFAMKRLVDMGEYTEAPKLVEISSAHVSGVSYLTGGDGLIAQLNAFVKRKCKVSVPCFLNPCGMDLRRWEEMDIPKKFAQKQERIIKMYKSLGLILSCSCTPYDSGNITLKGEHLAWAESSAATFANSFFGARTNKEDAITALAAAVIGKTPFYGLHLTKNRIPNILINVKTKLRSATDFSLLGYYIGKYLINKPSLESGYVPVFRGISYVRPYHVKLLSSAIATSGTSYMFHIEGVTPEQELISEKDITERVTVTDEDLKGYYKEFAPIRDPKLIVIGCPHTSVEGLMKISEYLDNRKIREGVELWIFTSRATETLAEATSYTRTIEKSGAKVFCDTCPVVMPIKKEKYSYILTNSAKAAHYISAPGLNDVPTAVLPLKKCIEIATGK